MIKIKKAFHFLLIIIITIASFIMCSSQQDDNTTGTITKSFPTQEGWNSELMISRLGKTQAIIQYGHMAQYEEQEAIELDEGVEVDFYDQDGNHTSHLTSHTGSYVKQTQNVNAKGQVVAVSDSGVTLRTEALSWNNQLGKIISDTLVQVTTQRGDTLWGVGFESKSDLSHWIIKKPWGVSEQRLHLGSLDSAFTRSRKKPEAEPDSTIIEGISE